MRTLRIKMRNKQRTKYSNRDGTFHYRTAIYMNEQDQEMYEWLKAKYGMNGSSLIRHLITEAYSILKYVKVKK